MTNDQIKIGIDLGGTKIEIAVIDDTHQVLYKKRTNTPGKRYEDVIQEIKTLVDECTAKFTQKSTIGIGIPGVISTSTGLVKNANLQCLISKPLETDLTSALRQPVKICNDANCFTLSEAVDGSAEQFSVVFGVIIGTGTGGGIVINKKVLTGTNAIAGEWGHNPLPWPTVDETPGPECYCGRNGCIETYLSGPGLVNDYFNRSNQTLCPQEIVKLAENDNLIAKTSVDCYIDRLARSLANVINILDPDVIVLGGGLSNIDLLYNRVKLQWGKYIFSDDIKTVLVQAKHGDSSGVRGAAWLWNSSY